MTYFEAALLVLQTSPEPLSDREILEQIQSRELVATTGKTPLATLSATLYRHLGSHPQLRRVCEPGRQRPRRGSVRWTVHH